MPRVNISPTIANEYISRCVWENEGWECFPEQAGRMLYVSEDTARAMLADAEFQGDARRGPEEMPRGVRRAYQTLAQALREALKG